MTIHSKRYFPFLFLMVVVVFGFWQVSFLVYSLKWDLIDVVFPFRYHFSECIQSGYFPFWNPYLQTGTPFFADLQAPTFYPELLFVSLFTGYGIYIMHFLFIAYVIIAGTGMYQLSWFFNKNNISSLMAGIAYAFSGYLVGHGQHFFLLIGAAWIPFVIVNYLRLFQQCTFIQALKTSVFVFLMVSGSYQALSFTLFYFLLLVFIYFILKELINKNIDEIKKIVKVNLQLLFMVILFLLPLIVSTLDILTSVNRLKEGINLEQSVASGQTIKSAISFVLPFSSVKHDEFFGGADISMRNHYFGIIPLLFFLFAIFKKRTIPEYLFLVFGLVIFASSFKILHVREFLFNYIPFMNLFKYAAYIRVFGLIAFILLAANYLNFLVTHFEKERKKLIVVGLIFLAVFFVVVGFSLQKINISDFNQLIENDNFNNAWMNMSFYQNIFIQAIFQLVIVAGFLLVIFFHNKRKSTLHWLIFLIILDVFVATQFNMNFTVTGHDYKPIRMNKDLALFPKKFPLPVNDKIIYNDQQHVLFQPFWRNTYTFSKQVSFGAFSSFELNSYSKLDDEYHNLRNAVLNNHLFYFSDRILPMSEFCDSTIEPGKDSSILFLSEEDYALLKHKEVKTDTSDIIRILEFSPSKVTIETDSENNQFLTMLQTSFKGWQAFIDGEKTPIYTSNFNYRTLFLPAGKNLVRFEYRNNKILILYIISNLAFFLCVLFLIGNSLKNKNLKKYTIVSFLSLIVILTSFFLIKRLIYIDNNKPTQEVLEAKWAGKKAFFNYTNDFENWSGDGDTTKYNLGLKSKQIHPENEYFDVVTINHQNNKTTSATMVLTVDVFSKIYPEALIVSDLSRQKNGWHATRIEKQIERPHRWNKIIYQRNFYDLKENDEIKIYIWNLNKLEFAIDNISVNLYPLTKNN